MSPVKTRSAEYDPGLAAHLQEFPDTVGGGDPLEGWTPATQGEVDPLEGWTPSVKGKTSAGPKERVSPGWKVLTGDLGGAGQDIAELGRTVARDPKRAASALGGLLYDFTLGPLISTGQVLTEGRTPEQARALETMTPEQRAFALESGQQYASPYAQPAEQLIPQAEALQGAAMVGSFVGQGGAGSLTRRRGGPSQVRRPLRETAPTAEQRPLLALPPAPEPRFAVMEGGTAVPLERGVRDISIEQLRAHREAQQVAGSRLTDVLNQVAEQRPSEPTPQRALPGRREPLALPPANRPRFMVRENGEVIPIEGAYHEMGEVPASSVVEPRTGLLDTSPRPTIEAAHQFEATVQRYRDTLAEVTRLEDAGLPVPKDMRRQLAQDWQSLQYERPSMGAPTEVPALPATPTPPGVAKGPTATAQAQAQAKLARTQEKIDKLKERIGQERAKRDVRGGTPLVDAPVSYAGYQEGFGKVPGAHLYNLEKTLSETLVQGSTVTENSLLKAGYKIPEAIKPQSTTTLQAGFDPKQWFAMNTFRVLSKVRQGTGGVPAHTWNIGKEVFNKVLGPEIAEKLDVMEQLERMLGNRYSIQLRRTPLNKLTPAESLNLVDSLRGRDFPMNAKVAAASKNSRQLMDDTALEIVGRGGEIYKPGQFDAASGARLKTGTYKPFEPVSDYYPELLNYRYVAKNPEARLVAELQAEMPQTPSAIIQDLVAGIRAQALGKPVPPTVGPEAMRLMRKMQTVTPHMMERSGISWPSEWLLPPQEALPLYTKNMAHEMAVLEQFGPRDALMEGPLQAAAQRGVPGVDLAYKVWDELIRGRAPRDPVSRFINQWHSILGNLATMGFIGVKTTIKQFSQLGLVAGEARSLKNFLSSFPKAVSKVGKAEADWWGATFDDVARDLIEASRKEGGHPSATWLDTIERKTRHGATTVVHWAKTPHADAFGRRVGYHMAVKDIADLQAKALGGDMKAAGWLKEEFHLDATSPADKVNFEAARWTNKVNLRTGPLDVPVIAHMPRVKAVFHLQKFNLSWTNRLYNGYVKPLTQAIKAKDRDAIARHVRRSVQLAGASVIVGEGISDAIHTLVGRADDRPGGTFTQFATDIIKGDVEAKHIAYRALDDMAFSGMFGYLQLVKEGILAPESAVESTSRLIGLKTGAGWSNVIELAAHAGQIAKTGIARKIDEKTGEPKEFNRALKAGARALTSRIPVVGGVVGPRLFPGSESREQERAVTNIVRALKRKDHKQVAYWQEWFYKRHGKNISPQAIERARSK